MAFRTIKEAPPLPITEVYIPTQVQVHLTWQNDNVVTCSNFDPEVVCTGSPVRIEIHLGG